MTPERVAPPVLPPLRIGTWLAPVVPDILIEHLLELAFLAIQKRKLIFSSDIGVNQLQSHSERCEAHWDGLVIGGAASAAIALERFDEFDIWETAVAVRTWVELGGPSANQILDSLATAMPEKLPGWREGMRSVSKRRLLELFPQDSAVSGPPGTASTLVYALGWNEVVPPNAADLAFNAEPAVRWSMARSLGWNPAAATAAQLLGGLLTDPEPDVRRAAMWSEVMFNPLGALARTRQAVRSGAADRFQIRMLGLLGTNEDAAPLQRVGSDPASAAATEQALADLAAAEGLPWKGPPADEPMLFAWRSSLRAPRPGLEWLRREVPDGFFRAAPEDAAVPGE